MTSSEDPAGRIRRRSLLLGGLGLSAAGGAALAWRASAGSMATYRAHQAQIRAEPAPKAGMVDLIRIATLAPSGHNAQPWRFRLGPSVVEILPDFERRTPAVDPDDHHLHVSLGAAAETLSVAGPAFGRAGEVLALENGSLRYDYVERSKRYSACVVAILRRQSVRADYDPRLPSAVELDAIMTAATSVPGVRVTLVADRPRIERIRDLSVEGARAQFEDTAFTGELLSWIRFCPREALARGDGLFSASLDAPVLPEALGRAAFRMFATAAAEERRVARQLAATPALVLFFAEEATPRGWAQVGRALTRFTLAATTRGLKTAHANQAVEVARLRQPLAEIAGEPGLRPDLVLRLGYGPELPYATRRPVARVVA